VRLNLPVKHRCDANYYFQRPICILYKKLIQRRFEKYSSPLNEVIFRSLTGLNNNKRGWTWVSTSKRQNSLVSHNYKACSSIHMSIFFSLKCHWKPVKIFCQNGIGDLNDVSHCCHTSRIHCHHGHNPPSPFTRNIHSVCRFR